MSSFIQLVTSSIGQFVELFTESETLNISQFANSLYINSYDRDLDSVRKKMMSIVEYNEKYRENIVQVSTTYEAFAALRETVRSCAGGRNTMEKRTDQ